MNKNHTGLTIVLDRSGSMSGIRSDMEGALQTLIDEQRATPGTLCVSLVQFDNEFESVFTALPAEQVRAIHIAPRGSTALLDAVAQTIDRTGQRLGTLVEADRPGTVLFVIVTDGEENASQQYHWADVQTRIKHQADTYQWQFIFLGSNIDAIATADRIGIARGDALEFNSHRAGVDHASKALSEGMRRKRAASAAGGHAAMAPAFLESDRTPPAKTKKKSK